MDIGILGAGHIGGTVGELWARAGHRVQFAATDLGALEPLVASIGPNASTGSPAEAVAFGEVVLVALPAQAVIDVLAASGSLDGKVAIDAANGFGANATPFGALIERFGAARWVRAFNTLRAAVLADENHREPPYAMLLSGDDEEAKKTVAQLIRDSGFVPVDVGGSADVSLQDPGSPLWNNALTEAQAREALEELRTTGHTSADPLAQAVRALADRGPGDPAWWLEQVTRAVFRAGMSWRVVEAKWPGFRADFHEFDPAAVAAMDEAELARVESDPQVIRNVRKLEATVGNAAVLEGLLSEHGSFRKYLSSFAEPADVADDLAKRFKFLSAGGASRLLLEAARTGDR